MDSEISVPSDPVPGGSPQNVVLQLLQGDRTEERFTDNTRPQRSHPKPVPQNRGTRLTQNSTFTVTSIRRDFGQMNTRS